MHRIALLAPLILAASAAQPAVAAPGTLTLHPVADAYVSSACRGCNSGTLRTLKLEYRSSAVERRPYLKFDLPGLPAGSRITRARLDLRVLTAGDTPATVRAVADDSWAERGLTYANRPSVYAAALPATRLSNRAARPRRATADVTRQVAAEGPGAVYSVAVVRVGSGSTVTYSSRGGSAAPRLVVDYVTPARPVPEERATPAPEVRPPAPVRPAARYGAAPIASGLFAQDWGRRLAPDQPLHTQSATWATNLRAQMQWPDGGPEGWYMGFADSICGHPLYVVPADVPLTPVRVRNASVYGVSGPELDAALSKGVPLPDGWQPGNCAGDRQVAIYQPATGKYWDFLGVQASDARFGGVPSVFWGGFMNDVATNPGHFRDVWNAQWVFSQRSNWGASATSLPLMAGIITKEDVRSGVIDHAISMAVGQAHCAIFLRPAMRHDCLDTSSPVPEGARFRFPADVDVNAYVATFHAARGLTPPQDAAARRFLRMLIVAGRDHGFIVSDQTGLGPSLYFRDYTITDGAVSWADIVPSRPLVRPFEYMRSMPWDQAEVVAP